MSKFKFIPMKKQIISLAFVLTGLISNLGAIPIQKLKLEQGLSNNYVVGITQDKQGIIWIATRSGLNRFDGREFRIFNKADENSINGNELNTVYADPTDNLIWIATARQGLNVFDCKTYKFSSFTHDPNDPYSLSSNGPTDIKSDPKGNLWIATYDGGIDYFDKYSRKFHHYNQSNVKGLPSNMVWSISDDHKGNLYIAHDHDGMSILSLKSRTARNFRHDPDNPASIPDNKVSCVFIDSYNNVWVGTEKGLSLFNPDDGKFTVFHNIPGNKNSISNDFISCIHETADKKLLIGTVLNGLNTFDLKQMFFVHSPDKLQFEQISSGNNDNELSNPYVKSIFNDTYGNIWVSTYGGGVNFISNRKPIFNTYQYNPIINNPNSLSYPIVWGLCIDRLNSLWISTDGGGIDLFRDNRKVANYSLKQGNFPANNIFAAFTDSERSQWFGTYDGLVIRHKDGASSFEKISGFDIKDIHVNCFYEDRNKNIWIGTNKGLHSYNLITRAKHSYYSANSGISHDMVTTVTQDNQGHLWVGTYGGQICVLDSYVRRLWMISPTNNEAMINQLYRDSQNRIWAATGENLFMFQNRKDNHYKTYGIPQGLSDNIVTAVTEGNDGQIWFSTFSGISSLNPNSNRVKNFNRFDGIPMANFRMGAVAKSNDGTIYFGSDNGVCYFNPRVQVQGHAIPPVTITDFTVSNVEDSYTGKLQYFPTLDRITLKYNQNTFSIAFNVPDYSFNNQIEFSYMLEGLENVWYNIRNTKEVTFRNLPPGKYTFHIKSRYKNQEWSEAKTTLAIVINPPVWLTWWAKIVYTLLILSIAIYVFRFYQNRIKLENSLYLEKQNSLQQQELNNERLRFYTNITHELRTPLTLILGPLEDLINDMKTQDSYRGKIQTIYKSALRLLDLINQILEFRKTESQNRKLCVLRTDLAKQINEIAQRYSELNRNPGLAVRAQIEGGDFNMLYDPEVITIVLDNLISNAIKYTPTGEINLKLRQLEENGIGYTEIEVLDTGYGIDQVSLPFIFDRYYQANSEHQASGTGIGLAIVKSLVELHEAEISVSSQPEEGTAFRIRLITQNTYPNALHMEIRSSKTEEKPDDTRPIMLVVEDNDDIRRYISETFAQEYEVLTASNGRDGLEVALSRIPDIIISDVMMPIMDGTEFCKQVKEDLRTSHIPFIMLTAKDTIQDKTEGYTAGADSYITKPFSGTLLHSRVTNLIETRKRMAALFEKNIHTPQINQEKPPEQINPLDNEFISKITKYIEEHLSDENINVASIADVVFMSHSTLYRKVKALTGLTTNELIRKIRLQHARDLLATGRYNISEVMDMVGISSTTYFRSCFKEEFGVAPSDMIKQNKK